MARLLKSAVQRNSHSGTAQVVDLAGPACLLGAHRAWFYAVMNCAGMITHRRMVEYVASADYKLLVKHCELQNESLARHAVELERANRETAMGAGIPPIRIHFESFGSRRVPIDRQIGLELRNSDITILIDPGRPLLEAIEAIETVGIWVPAECRRAIPNADSAVCAGIHNLVRQNTTGLRAEHR